HMNISGLVVSCETTATVGCSAAAAMPRSGFTAPSTMSSSRYMSAETGWKPTLGPPGRTSMSTPVSTPCATSDPRTTLASASITRSGPTRLYIAPCSASGCQSCCITTVAGHTPARSSGPPAGAAAVAGASAGAGSSAGPPPHAVSASAAAADRAMDAARGPVGRLMEGDPRCCRLLEERGCRSAHPILAGAGGVGKDASVSEEPTAPYTGTGIDTTVPHSARSWNYFLGGEGNYAVDREAGDAIAAIYPQIRVNAREARGFLRRVVEFLAGGTGIRQFLDIGTGLPTANNTHEVAQRVAPE